MNKLKTDQNGGMPFVVDDLRWIDDSVRDAFLGVLSAFGDSYRLSGAVATVNGTNLDISDGYVVIGGEVMEVVAHSVTNVSGNDYYFQLEENTPGSGGVPDADGYKLFGDAISRDTYYIRRAHVIGDTTQPPNSLAVDAQYLSELTDGGAIVKINQIESTWIYLTPTVAVNGGSISVTEAYLKHKIIGKTMHINVKVEATITGSANFITVALPTGVTVKNSVGGAAMDKLTTTDKINVFCFQNSNLIELYPTSTFSGDVEIYLNLTTEIN